jgi:hypothetical protein
MMTKSHEQQFIECLSAIGTHIKYLGNGDAATTMGAIENLAVQLERLAQANERIAEANMEISKSIDFVAQSLASSDQGTLASLVKEGLVEIADAIEARK